MGMRCVGSSGRHALPLRGRLKNLAETEKVDLTGVYAVAGSGRTAFVEDCRTRGVARRGAKAMHRRESGVGQSSGEETAEVGHRVSGQRERSVSAVT